MHATEAENPLDWELVELPAPAQNVVREFLAESPAKLKFKRVVRKVVRLLKLRILWSRIGRTCQIRPGNQTDTSNPQLVLLRRVWGKLGIWLRPYSTAFAHVERRGGVLRYRWGL